MSQPLPQKPVLDSLKRIFLHVAECYLGPLYHRNSQDVGPNITPWLPLKIVGEAGGGVVEIPAEGVAWGICDCITWLSTDYLDGPIDRREVLRAEARGIMESLRDSVTPTRSRDYWWPFRSEYASKRSQLCCLIAEGCKEDGSVDLEPAKRFLRKEFNLPEPKPPMDLAGKILKELAENVLAVQDACNLSAVLYSWVEDMNRLRVALEELKADDTDSINRHPINVLWADKVRQLTGALATWDVEDAYKKVLKLKEGKE